MRRLAEYLRLPVEELREYLAGKGMASESAEVTLNALTLAGFTTCRQGPTGWSGVVAKLPAYSVAAGLVCGVVVRAVSSMNRPVVPLLC